MICGVLRSPRIDYTAARVIRELQQDLKEGGVALVFAHVQSDLKPDLERHRLTELLGPDRIFDRLHDALVAYCNPPRFLPSCQAAFLRLSSLGLEANVAKGPSSV